MALLTCAWISVDDQVVDRGRDSLRRRFAYPASRVPRDKVLRQVVGSRRGQHRNTAGDGLQNGQAKSFAGRKRDKDLGRLDQGVKFLLILDIVTELNRVGDPQTPRLLLQRRTGRTITYDPAGEVYAACPQAGQGIQEHIDALVFYQAADDNEVGELGSRAHLVDQVEVDAVRHDRDLCVPSEGSRQALGRLR